jgi:hypothetical protein
VSPTEQRDRALIVANEKRMRVVEIRRQVKSGQLALADLLADPPDEILHMTLFDVVRMTYTSTRAGASMETLGRRALQDGVNLLVQVGRSSMRSREWVAENVMWQHRPQEGRLRRYVEVLP